VIFSTHVADVPSVIKRARNLAGRILSEKRSVYLSVVWMNIK